MDTIVDDAVFITILGEDLLPEIHTALEPLTWKFQSFGRHRWSSER
jgi:hypothetical protein